MSDKWKLESDCTYHCLTCQWDGDEDEITTLDEETGEDCCPACGETTLVLVP